MSLLTGGTASGSGKTTTAVALLAALKQRGISPRPAKAGPDFIDAAWLSRAAGSPCLNLDIWMAGSSQTLVRMAQNFAAGQFMLVEGVMGLFDGARDGSASSAQLASLLDLPVLLLLNCAGLGQSAAAMAKGFLTWKPDWLKKPLNFCGIICTHTGGASHQSLLAESLAKVCSEYDAPLLGFLPKYDAPMIPSRHLGLKQASESQLDFEKAGQWFSQNCDLDKLLERCPASQNAPSISCPHSRKSAGPVIAIARDEAFSFCYADLPDLLAEMGAGIVWFSPLADTHIPACDGVYLPGGYPEVFISRLSANRAILHSLRELAAGGTPIYGECGGFIFLLQGITVQEKFWPLTGLLPGRCHLQDHHAALGYRLARPEWLCAAELRGHEFHYAELTAGDPCPSLWELSDSRGRNLGRQGMRCGKVAGSWLHLYPEGSRPFWRAWLELCKGGKNYGQA